MRVINLARDRFRHIMHAVKIINLTLIQNTIERDHFFLPRPIFTKAFHKGNITIDRYQLTILINADCFPMRIVRMYAS